MIKNVKERVDKVDGEKWLNEVDRLYEMYEWFEEKMGCLGEKEIWSIGL